MRREFPLAILVSESLKVPWVKEVVAIKLGSVFSYGAFAAGIAEVFIFGQSLGT